MSDGLYHIAKVERAEFFGHACVKNDLEEQVA